MALERIPGTAHITKVSIHEAEIFEHFPQLKIEDCHQLLHLIDEKGTILVGEKAVSYLISQFPGVKKFAWLLESNMGEKTVNFFYEMSEKYRKTLLKRCPGCKNKRIRNSPS